jgi:hypothetical protein
MFCDSGLTLETPVSELLLKNADALQDVLRRFLNWRRAHRDEYFLPDWRSRARRVPVHATKRDPESRSAGVGCFFSGGLDSFYTLLTRTDEITHLIYVLGYDVFEHQPQLAREIVDRLQVVASSFDKQFVVLKSDLRTVSNRLLHWHIYHGAALAAAGHLLRAELGQIYIPSTYTYEHLVPLGTHPSLDPLWSSHELEFIHHGGGADRPEKALVVGASEVAREHLRVCWENRGGLYNCGRCEKCRRTQVEFEVAGWGGQLASLPSTISLHELGTMQVDPRTVKFWQNCLIMAQTRGGHPALLEALEARLRETPVKRARYMIKQLMERLKHWFLKWKSRGD